MSESAEMLGTKVLQYESVDEFRGALDTSKPARLHTFFNGGLFGFGASWAASFIDSEGTVHGFITDKVGDDFKERVKPIYDAIGMGGIPEVDGVIKVSQRNGDVYHLFQTDNPGEEGRVQASYDAWVSAVRGLPVEGTLVQYLREDSAVTLDATRGKNHLITTIDESSGRTLEETLTKLRSTGEQSGVEVLDKPYATRDNRPVVDWYLDMKNE
jgi:hypothetical protein